MNSIHDMGGMHGFGSVATDDDGPFHHEWEETFHGVTRVLGVHGIYTGDENRHMRERLAPAECLRAGYYERRLLPAEWILIEAGILEEGDVDARMEATTEVPERTDPELVDRAREAISTNSNFHCGDAEPAFDPGDDVVVRNIHPDGHTRCPRYVRRARGVIDTYHGSQRFPDESIDGEPVGEPLYSVRFDAREIWGEDHSDRDSLVLQLWEPYLRSA